MRNVSLTESVANYALSLRYEDIPENVLVHARTLLADHLACAFGGSVTPLASSVRAFARFTGGEPRCSVPGLETKTSTLMAAFVQASFANALDYDDTGSRGHPGASIIPAVLALSSGLKLSGRELLTAMVIGYEVNDRVARATLPSPECYAKVHANGSLQAIGVAAACGRLVGLDREKMLNCLGIAGAMAPVPHAGKFGWEDKSIASVKDNVALPSENGVRAAVLALSGYEGSESVLDGESGFAAMLGSDRCDPDILSDFSTFTLPGVCLKPYPCCRWIHPALDALSELKADCGFSARDVVSLDVATTPPVAARFGKKRARTFLDMEFSTPLTLALLLNDVPRARWFEARHWDSPSVRETAAVVTLTGDDGLWKRFLELGRNSSCVPAAITVTLRDGRKLKSLCDRASGSPEKPLSTEAQARKWRELMVSACGQDAAELLTTAHRIDELACVDTLTSLFPVVGDSPEPGAERS